MIYFIQPEGESTVKIGYTKNIKNRIAELQTSNARELKVLLLLPGRLEEEEKYHVMFSDDKVRGEWFYLSTEIKDFIKSMYNNDLRYDEGLLISSEDNPEWHTRNLRTQYKLSLQELGNRLNITAQSVKEIESRELVSKVTLETLRKYGDVLGYALSYKFVKRKV